MFSRNLRKLVDKCIMRFPLVRPEFYFMNWREQMAENNQEIHELNKRLDELEARLGAK